jgi:hypothetical protein
LVEVPAEQAALALMRQWRAEGTTLEQITERLHAEGHPTKRGGTWRIGTVGHILTPRPATTTTTTEGSAEPLTDPAELATDTEEPRWPSPSSSA